MSELFSESWIEALGDAWNNDKTKYNVLGSQVN